MATIIDIANAVVSQLNGASLSQPLSAERHYQPRFDLEEMTDLHVSVVPRSLSSRALDRNRHSFDYQVDVAIQQKTDVSEGELDPLMSLVEEIADHLRNNRLTDHPDARVTGISNDPVYSPEHLEELRQFTSVLTLTYRVGR